MKLYTLLSTADRTLVKKMFFADVITRAVPYINKRDIIDIAYDSMKDTCTARVYGTEQYTTSIGLDRQGGIVPRCTCPAARGMTPYCKHAAALLMVIVEYFSQWKWVKPKDQQYYALMLDDTFDEIKSQAAWIATQPVPTFTKPAIVFIRSALIVHPHIVLINGSDKTNKIARIIEKNVASEFDATLEKVFERQDLFDFFVYTDQGLMQVPVDTTQKLTPVWQLQHRGDTVELSFVCIDNNGLRSSCIPLGNRYVLDSVQNKIIPLSVVDSYCYKSLNEMALSFALLAQLTDNDYLQPVGTVADIRQFLAIKHRLTPLQNIPVASDRLQRHFAFPDKNFKMNRTHCAVIDGDNKPVDLGIASIEQRFHVKQGIHLDSLIFEFATYAAGSEFSYKWPVEHQDFFGLLNTLFDKKHDRALLVRIISAMIAFAQSFRDAGMTEESRKKLFFGQVGPKKSVGEDFFAQMNLFWQGISTYDTYRLVRNQETGTFEYSIFSKIDILIAASVVINFFIKNQNRFEVHEEYVSLMGMPLSKKDLGHVAEYLRTFGLITYFENKKVVQRIIDVEIDMESADDWFSIKPSFYEKGVMLSEEEWQRLLTATGLLQESETEVQIFDENTEKMLAALRTVKGEYRSGTGSERARFEIPRLHIFTLLGLHKSGVKLKASDEDKKILKNLQNFTHIPSYAVPVKLQCSMRDYQTKGYDWLAFLYEHKFGACLADEMGLGKTVQTIAFLAGIHEGRIRSWDPARKRQHLIVAPASVVGNWEQEIKRFYPTFITKLYLGSQRAFDPDLIDIIITTYDTLRSDLDTFKNIPFHVIIFDEAQAVKNQKSQRADAARQLQSLFKLSLTGTPLENNALELCSLMNITLPGLLPDNSVVMQLIKKGEYQAFHERIAPFILRRTKQEYLQDLPDKTEHDVYLAMTKTQKGYYGAIVDEIKKQVYKAYREKTSAQAGIIALTALLRLRQICASPALVDDKQENLSPKVEYLLAEIANYIQEKTPILVFSQFVGMLDIVMHFLQKKKIPYLRIDGTVSALQRKKIVEEFQKSNKIFVLLLSLKTGGVGLNLTRARVVIHLDPWWNPAVENQASDRVHRIGQEHDVKIIRLLMKDSIEEKMLVLKQKKQKLFEAIMEGASGSRCSALTKQDFDFLLNEQSASAQQKQK